MTTTSAFIAETLPYERWQAEHAEAEDRNLDGDVNESRTPVEDEEVLPLKSHVLGHQIPGLRPVPGFLRPLTRCDIAEDYIRRGRDGVRRSSEIHRPTGTFVSDVYRRQTDHQTFLFA